MRKFLKKNWGIIIVLLLALILRFKFSTMKTHGDLLAQLEWGKQADLKGTLKDFYEWGLWGGTFPNPPPLMGWLYFIIYPLHNFFTWFLSNLGNFIALHRLAPTKFIWLFNFAIWFGRKNYSPTIQILSGNIMLLKQFMILADLSIGLVIFYLCKKAKVNWVKPVLIYLFLPFSWYLSSSWGQSDPLSFLFLIISFILLTSKRFSITSPILYAIAANLKPNCILLLPVYLYVWYKQKQPTKNLILGTSIALIFTFWIISWFTDKNIFNFTFTVLSKRLPTDGGLINFNAFNFWYIFYPFSIQTPIFNSNIYLMLTAKTWGWILAIATTILSFNVIKFKKIETIFAAMFIAGFGSWLFMTGMHERYSFIGLIPLLLVSIYQKKFLKYFLILSTIYTLNLFIAFWPWENLSWINQIFEFNYFLIPRLLSLINVIIYFWVTILLLQKSNRFKIKNQ